MATESTMLTTGELAERWRVSIGLIRGQIYQGKIPTLRVGRRYLVPVWWIEDAEKGEIDNG
jgi:excisionase family DNA binding protein